MLSGNKLPTARSPNTVKSATTFRSYLAIAGTLGILVLAGCSGGDQETSSVSGDMSANAPSDMAFSESAPAEMGMDAGQRPADQQFIRTGAVSLISNNATATVSEITELVEQFNGSISQADIRTIEDNDYANMTVRVPDSDLEAFITEVRELGETVAFNISQVDVTLTLTDLNARIDSLNTTIAKLLQLQEQATTVTDLVAVETELATRTAERDSLVAQRDVVQNQVAESTVYIDISPDLGKKTNAPDFIGGLESGWQALINIGAGAITLVGFLIPIALAIFVLVVIAVVAIRLIGRARQRN